MTLGKAAEVLKGEGSKTSKDITYSGAFLGTFMSFHHLCFYPKYSSGLKKRIPVIFSRYRKEGLVGRQK